VIEADVNRFKCARDGDNLMVPFQCDVCHFRNIQKRNPRPLLYPKDALALQCIRRANLDSLWSREPSTVSRNANQARTMEDLGDALGFGSVAPPMGPFPLEDTFGMKIACVTLMKSLDPGKWEATVQHATARRMRSVYSNLFHASFQGESMSVMAYETQKMFTTPCPTYGYWYQRFNLGLHKRMGDVVRSDFAVTSQIIKALLETLNEEWEDAVTLETRTRIAEMAFVLVAGYCCGLRGEEITKIDLAGLLKYLEPGRLDTEYPHAIVPLIGRIKGETGERYHMMVLARETKSGIQAGIWADRIAEVNKARKRDRGPVFRTKKGHRAKIASFEAEFLERMIRLKIARPGLFEPGVDISESYSLFRSLRRGSTTEATKNRVAQDIIELNNRWRKFDRARGMKPSLGMKDHYTEIKLILSLLWQYSRAL
jgi:hypothetical protein